MTTDLLCNSPIGASRRLVLLHGWGADVDDLMPLGKTLVEEIPSLVELIALRAPQNHPSGNGRQWYGLYPPDWDVVPAVVEELKGRLRNLETENIPLQKTVLFGFSQGGAMAIAGCKDLPLAGLIVCSGYPHPQWMPSKTMPPVYIFHGKSDDIVPVEAATQLATAFQKKNIQYNLCLFEGGHGIPNEITPHIRNAVKSLFLK